MRGLNAKARRRRGGKWKLESENCKMEIGARLAIMPGMRKWVVVGVALVAVAVGAYLLSQPRNGSLEYHKRKYLAASRAGKWQGWIKKNGPISLGAALDRRAMKVLAHHRRALIGLGYLEHRTVVVSNPCDAVFYKTLSVNAEAQRMVMQDEFLWWPASWQSN